MKKIPKKSPESILSELSLKSNENLSLLTSLETALKNLRGYIYKIPAPGTPVVSSFSGGLDSIITTALLIEEFDLQVFPFFINRDQTAVNDERQSSKFFEKLYLDRYPNRFMSLIEMTASNPPQEIKSDITSSIREKTGYPMRNAIMMYYGVQYAFSLLKKNITVKNVFSSSVADDTRTHSSLTAHRSQMLSIIADLNDPTWQLTSIAIEKEVGMYANKIDLIHWAAQRNIPIEHTHSCQEPGEGHCGSCDKCQERKSQFRAANVTDQTQYRS